MTTRVAFRGIRTLSSRPWISSSQRARIPISQFLHPALSQKYSTTPSDLEGQVLPDTAKQDEGKKTGLPEQPLGSPPTLASRPTPQLFSLSNRTIIVTGAAQGLGLTITQALLESGANVCGIDMNPKPSESGWSDATTIANEKGLELSYHQLDITDGEKVSSLFPSLFDSAPSEAPIRGMYHAAGIQLLTPATKFTPPQFRKIIDVNLTGTFLVSQAFAKEWFERYPDMKGADSGGLPIDGGASIVLTGSMSGHVANKGLECAAYNASKAGVNQLVRNLAMEWGKRGIRVNSLSPGYIRTAMTAVLLEKEPHLETAWLDGGVMGRLSTPDEFRGPVVFLLSDASSFMTGADILVDGGHTAT